MNIVNVGYDSTNYYVLADSMPRLLIDVGFPKTLPKLQSQCKRMGVALDKLKYFVATHYHPDHAGMAEELKRTGCRLIVLEPQIAHIPQMRGMLKPRDGYVDITEKDVLTLRIDESRRFLGTIGITGEFVETLGHSDDSVSLVLDDGSVFVGDFPPPVVVDDPSHIVSQGWERIRAMGGKTVYPGHGPRWALK